MRTIKKIHPARYAPIADLKTYTALPTSSIQQIDPFILLNHHGPQKYPPFNQGLPFGPHPHRGMETVTFILAGEIKHKDSSGHESTIEAGGIQWMTAGKGVIHSETTSDEFKTQGGDLEILQLWLNLPAKDKMTEPHYEGFQKDQIPAINEENGSIKIQLVAGEWENKKGAFQTVTNVTLALIFLSANTNYNLKISVEENIFFYVIKGNLSVNNKEIDMFELAEFENDEEEIQIKSQEESIVLFGHARPLNEPVVAQGPFVMNTEEEIVQAYKDYRNGKFGSWDS